MTARITRLGTVDFQSGRGRLYHNALRTGGEGSLRLLFLFCAGRLNPLRRKLNKKRLGIEDYIRLILHRQNLQCRLIAGIGNSEACDERALDTADENLTRSLRLVGLCGRFRECLMLMAKTFGREVRFMRITRFERPESP